MQMAKFAIPMEPTLSIDTQYRIALTLIPGVGSILAKSLLGYCGSPEAVFRMPKAKLEKIPGIGRITAQRIANANVLKEAEDELRFVEKEGIRLIFFTDEDYPFRLKQCMDGPILLYYKGTADLNHPKIIGIVGTRNATEYGRWATERIVEELAPWQPLVISGLAYGIDIAAHKAALAAGLETIGVVGHGLDRIYPAAHRDSARKMMEQGGLLTEFPSGTNPDRENFPARNRVVAGMVDALIVVETAIKGGAMITADIAASYARDVFAVPGRLNDPLSAGCLKLIEWLKAAVYPSAPSFARNLGWETEGVPVKVQARQLSLELSGEEQRLYELLPASGPLSIEDIYRATGLPPGVISSTLLELEFKGLVKVLPGSRFQRT